MAVKCVALIRGINVGRAKRVAMADLRTLVRSLGYSDVRTLLNSGNIVFDAPGADTYDCAAAIEEGLASTLGVTARVAVLTAADLDAIMAGNPLLELADDPSRMFASVLLNAADRDRLELLLDQDWRPEGLGLGDRVAYIWCPRGMQGSRAPAAVERALGGAVTTRNWATMTKLQALAS
ncbi:MAG: DUF1697 domain-containing protein [Gemmatimonadota bacterium]